MHIDHVIWATRDIEAAGARFLAEHGLGSVAGGDHAAWGTGNRIVPAGPAYIEVMGIRNAQVAREHPLGRWILASADAGEGPVAVCLAVDDLAARCERLGLEVTLGRRMRPDGTTLRWRMAGLDAAIEHGLPFFITWDAETGADVAEPESGARASAIVSVEVGGDPARLAGWLGGDVPGLVPVDGAAGVRRVVVEVGGREVVLGRDPD